jgi:hypothetical protein
MQYYAYGSDKNRYTTAGKSYGHVSETTPGIDIMFIFIFMCVQYLRTLDQNIHSLTGASALVVLVTSLPVFVFTL